MTISWNDYYNLAKQYYMQHQVLDLCKFDVFENANLGDWLDKQRTAYEAGELSSDRVELLDVLKFDWKKSEDLEWKEIYMIAEQFYLDHGHLSVSPKLGWLSNWLAEQRDAYQRGLLSSDRVKKLTSIGIKWGKNDNSESVLEWPSAVI